MSHECLVTPDTYLQSLALDREYAIYRQHLAAPISGPAGADRTPVSYAVSTAELYNLRCRMKEMISMNQCFCRRY